MAESESRTESTADALPAPPPADAADERIEPNAVVETAETSETTAPTARRASVKSVPAAPLASLAAPAGDAEPLQAYELLARSARLGDIVALAKRIITDAARARAADWAFTSKVNAAASEARLAREDADTKYGNVLDVLSTGGEGAAERALAAALWAHAVAESPRSRADEEDRLAVDILWLATHTAFDATSLLDRALGDEASDLWAAIGDRVRRFERGKGGALGRGEAIVACAALAASSSPKAKTLCTDLAKDAKDPVLLRVLSTGSGATAEAVRLDGELLPTPRGPIATTLLAFTGILFAVHAVRLVARVALAYRRPTEVSLTDSSIRVKSRTVLLGRTLREQEHVILRSGLTRVVREVRFPRAAFYAGLLALALGSYVGVRTFADGVRAASPSLLVVGLVIVTLGVAADFVLGTLLPGARGRCRVAFVPRTGKAVCVGDIDLERVDDALTRALGRH